MQSQKTNYPLIIGPDISVNADTDSKPGHFNMRSPSIALPAARFLILTFTLMFGSQASIAEEKLIQLENSKILGNEEQPGIMYIVPWGQPKRSNFLSESTVPIVNIDAVLKPVNPQSIAREFNYYKKVQFLSSAKSR